MKFLSILIICLSIQLLSANDAVNRLKQAIKSYLSTMPPNYSSLIGNLRGQSTADASSFIPEQFNSEMQRFGFNQEIVNKFANIIWSQAVEFQSFRFSYTYNLYSVEEFIGIAKNTNGLISIAFVKGTAAGDSMKPYYKTERQKKCRQCIDRLDYARSQCFEHYRCSFIEQDFTITKGDEITIDQALRGYIQEIALQKLNTMNGIENSLENFYKFEEEQKKHDIKQEELIAQLKEYKENCQNYVKSCPKQIQEKCIFLDCIKKDLSLTEKVLCNFKVEQCKKQLTNEIKIEKYCQQCICLQNKVITKGNVLDCL